MSSCSLHDLDSRGRMVAVIVEIMTCNRLHLRLVSAVNPHHTRLEEGYDLDRRSLPRENAIRRRFIGVGCSSRTIEPVRGPDGCLRPQALQILAQVRDVLDAGVRKKTKRLPSCCVPRLHNAPNRILRNGVVLGRVGSSILAADS